MGWLQTLAAELAITVSNQEAWLSIGQALLLAAAAGLFGTWAARSVGLLNGDEQTGETLAVGLASGLLVLAASWAALASSGRSSFTPVALGFALAIGYSVVRSIRTARPSSSGTRLMVESDNDDTGVGTNRWPRGARLVVPILGGAAFIIAVALLYGSTMALSPRGGQQPLEFMDEAYYSILARDIGSTGIESIYSPSGFQNLDGLPSQTWYHWGELWLTSVVIEAFGTAPLLARHIVVLPVVLLAAAALTGTLVRRVTRTESRGSYLFGFVACLFLAPIPLISGPYFSSWAVGLIFGISVYGLAAVAVLYAMYGLAVLDTRKATWVLGAFMGCAFAMILPAHVVIALLAIAGVTAAVGVVVTRSLVVSRRMPVVAPIWRLLIICTAAALIVTAAWGLLTGHGIGTSGLSTVISPFNASWREAVAITTLGSGAFLTIGIAWFLVRDESPIAAGLYVGTAALLLAGAIAWGARLGDFTMFHVFYAGIAVFATPVAAIAVWTIYMRLRAGGRRPLAIGLLLLCLAQLEIGIGLGVKRLQQFGPGSYAPVPAGVLEAIEGLPSDAKLAYACEPFEEVAFWDARLLGIDAHTGRRIVPMCFQAEFFGILTGGRLSADVPSPLFRWAPQRRLYPDASARPSPALVASFLKENGIHYIYADERHPNSLVSDAIPVAVSGDVQVLRIP